MDSVADAEYVARVDRVPKRGGVAEVGLRGEEEFEGDGRGGGRVCEDRVWFVIRTESGAEVAGCMPWTEYLVLNVWEVEGEDDCLLWRFRDSAFCLTVAIFNMPVLLFSLFIWGTESELSSCRNELIDWIPSN